MKLTVTEYKKIFYGQDRDDVPLNFSSFPQDQNADSVLEGEIILDEVQQEQIHFEIKKINKISEYFGFTPIITDLSLISDDRFESGKKHYIGNIVINHSSSERLMKAYIDAIKLPDVDSHEPIVSHTDFDSEKSWAISRLDVRDEKTRSNEANQHEGMNDLTSIKSYIYPLKPIDEYLRTSQDLASDFLANLENELKKFESHDTAIDLIRKSYFLVIPIFRTLEDQSQSNKRAGVLFLFGKYNPKKIIENVDNKSKEDRQFYDHRRLCRALDWLFKKSTDHESDRAYNKQLQIRAKQEELADSTYSISHPLKTRVTALSSEVNALFDHFEGRDIPAEQLGFTKGIIHHLKSFTDTIHMLYYVSNENLKTVYMQKNEFGKLRYSSQKDLDIQKTCNEAHALAYHSSRELDLDLNSLVNYHIQPYELNSLSQKYRVADYVYTEVFFEALINAVTHGLEQLPNRVKVSISVENIHVCDNTWKNAIIITNSVDQSIDAIGSTWSKTTWPKARGLHFITSVIEKLEAGSIYFKNHRCPEENHYKFSIALAMNGLQLK